MTATATAAPASTWMPPTRDKYGRPVAVLNHAGRTVAVMVTLPKTWKADHPDEAYLVNVWANPVRDIAQTVTYHATRNAAKAYAEAEAARFVA